jgi:hypothetical protein
MQSSYTHEYFTLKTKNCKFIAINLCPTLLGYGFALHFLHFTSMIRSDWKCVSERGGWREMGNGKWEIRNGK